MTQPQNVKPLLRQARAWSIAGVLLYNNWILGLFLNAHATFAGATTSELGVAGQPWAWLFRAGDILAGVCFLLGFSAIVRLGKTALQRRGLLISVAVLGLSTIIESFIRLECSSALSSACERQEQLGVVGWQDWFHTGESIVSYACIAALPLLVWWSLRLRSDAKARRLKHLSLALCAFMLLWGIETAIRFANGAASYGLEQRIFIVLFSWWYLRALYSRETPAKAN